MLSVHLGNPTRRWEDIINMDIKYETLWIGFIWLKVWCCEYGNDRSDFINGG